MNHFSQLLNVHGVNDIRQTEIHTAGMAIEKLKRHKVTGTDQIPTELIKAVGRTFSSKIHKLINSIWNTKGRRKGRGRSLYLYTIRRGIKQVVELQRHITFVNYIQNFIQDPPVKVKPVCRGIS